jgi:hypothetical protein
MPLSEVRAPSQQRLCANRHGRERAGSETRGNLPRRFWTTSYEMPGSLFDLKFVKSEFIAGGAGASGRRHETSVIGLM